MADPDKPDFIEQLQIEDEKRRRHEERSGIRGLILVGIAVVLIGWAFLGVGILVRQNFGRWGRERGVR